MKNSNIRLWFLAFLFGSVYSLHAMIPATTPSLMSRTVASNPGTLSRMGNWFNWRRPISPGISPQAAYMSTQLPPKPSLDPYETLKLPYNATAWDVFGVKPGAPLEEIKIEYHKLAKLYHPHFGELSKQADTNALMAFINWTYAQVTGKEPLQPLSKMASQGRAPQQTQQQTYRQPEKPQQTQKKWQNKQESDIYSKFRKRFQKMRSKTGSFQKYYGMTPSLVTERLVDLIERRVATKQDVQELIALGADQNAMFIVPKFLNKNYVYVTPLQYSLLYDLPEEVTLQLITPVSVNFGGISAETGKDLAFYPFMLASIGFVRALGNDPRSLKRNKVIQALLAHGINVNQQTLSEGKTLLHTLAELYNDMVAGKIDKSIYGSADIFKDVMNIIPLSSDLNPDIKDNANKTAAQYLQTGNIPEGFTQKFSTHDFPFVAEVFRNNALLRDLEIRRVAGTLSIPYLKSLGTLFDDLLKKTNYSYIFSSSLPKYDLVSNPYISYVQQLLIEKADPAIIEFIIEQSPKNILNYGGKKESQSFALTPLLLAAEEGNQKLVDKLLHNGANPKVKGMIEQAIANFNKRVTQHPQNSVQEFNNLQKTLTILKNAGTPIWASSLTQLPSEAQKSLQDLITKRWYQFW